MCPRMKVLRALLLAGASVDQARSEGFTPLYIACEHNHLGCVRELLGAHAHVNHANVDGYTFYLRRRPSK